MNILGNKIWRYVIVLSSTILSLSFLVLLLWTSVAFSLDDESTPDATILQASLDQTEQPPPPVPAPDLLEPAVDKLSERPASALQTIGGDIWVAQGPGPSDNGQVENIVPNDEVVGAIHTVVAHPTNPDILYIGATNGGVWKTTNATAGTPHWEPLIDQQGSLSIGALAFDPTDVTSNTLVAGNGRYSSFSRLGGERLGLLRTTDGGATWTTLDGGGVLVGKNISGVAPRGNTIVVSVNIADIFICGNIGIYRSTDGGATFNPVTNGIPRGVAYDLVGDPTDSNILYTNVVFGSVCSGGSNGFYKSTDAGASWSKISDATMDALIIDSTTSNMEISVGTNNNVYASIINIGQLAGVFRSGNGGTSWTQLDTPATNENGTDVGLNPSPKGPPAGSPMADIAGGQGAIHASILADPTDANLVYMGGDRQPHPAEYGGGNWPNSIGANDYSGRLFRGDASQISGTQFVHLTHANNVTPTEGGTANSSSPHADSREMAFDVNNNLIEVDDGGIYRRTNPQDNTGDWYSINGNIQTTEMHDIAYDSVSNRLMSGNQDTGTTYQTSTGGTNWDSLSTADGGDVAVDDLTLAGSGQSIRYSSYQNLGGFRRTVWDASGNLVTTSFPARLVISGDPISPLFVTPIVLNAVTPIQLLIGAGNGVYESLDQGNTITQILTNTLTNSGGHMMVYGGRRLGVDYPDILYAPSGSTIYVRTTAGGAVNPTTAPFPGSFIRGLAADPEDWMTAYAIDSSGNVYRTEDAGASTWTNITGDLSDPNLRSVVASSGTVFVSGSRGVYVMFTRKLGVWYELGQNLPNVPVWDMEYDATDDVLVAGTLGRGAWTLSDVSTILTYDVIIQKTVTPTTAVPGQAITYTLAFSNSGLLPTENVSITDSIPAVLSVTQINSSLTITNVGIAPDYVWQLGTLAANQQDTITISGILTTSLAAGLITNTAVITATDDANAANNVATASTTITVLESDVVMQKLVTPTTAVPGQAITYTLAFSNVGSASATSVFITDSIPSAISVSQIDSSLAITNVGTAPDYVWQVGTLAANQGGVITISGILTTPLAVGTITNTAMITADNDIDPMNNLTTAGLTIANVAPMAVDDAATVTSGGSVTILVLANDADTNEDMLHLLAVTTPMSGTAVISGTYIIYTPDVGFVGNDSFNYTIADDLGGMDTATVTITVTEAEKFIFLPFVIGSTPTNKVNSSPASILFRQ